MSNTHHVVGTGPRKVIFVHGWFGDRRSFAPLEPMLDTRHFTHVFMDCRGYGGMKEVRGQFTVEEIAADVLALADSLGFSDFSLVGHSMGGMAAQRALTRAPDRVRSLVAVAPVPASGMRFDETTWTLFSGAADKRENRFAIIDHATGHRHPRTWVDRLVDRSLEAANRDAFAAYLRSWARTDFSDEVNGLTHQVKVIVGEHDRALPVDLMQRTFLAWYPNASLEVIRGAGHYPMVETPAALAKTIDLFLLH